MSLLGKKAAILWNGDLQDKEFIVSQLDKFDTIICADGAADFLKEYDYLPDVIIGDLDSICEDTLQYYRERQVEFLRFPLEKDFTDSELTIRYLLEQGIYHATVFGFSGSRLDHSIANLGLLYYAVNQGISINYISRRNRIMCLKPGTYFFENQQKFYFSLVALFGIVKNISLSGAKYSLSSYTMKQGETIGISNEYIENICLEFEDGHLLVIESEKDISI